MFILKLTFFLRPQGLDLRRTNHPIDCRKRRKSADFPRFGDPFYSMSPTRFRRLESKFRGHDSVSYMSDFKSVGAFFRTCRKNRLFRGIFRQRKKRAFDDARFFLFSDYSVFLFSAGGAVRFPSHRHSDRTRKINLRRRRAGVVAFH